MGMDEAAPAFGKARLGVPQQRLMERHCYVYSTAQFDDKIVIGKSSSRHVVRSTLRTLMS